MRYFVRAMLTVFSPHSSRCSATLARGDTQESIDEDEEDAQGTFGQDLCYALVDRPETSSVCLAGWKAHYMGRLHDQQSPRHPLALILGYDLRLRPQR